MTAAYHLPQRYLQKQNVTKQTHSDTELTATILEEVTKERRYLGFLRTRPSS
jgi:hypothetical protein